ncbi:nucleotidyltransferase [Solibacillus sp. FSL R5-0449]|uniref:nucleotidyltransferase n=1 Tax=Solibacillus sp. FSL R5-0449 TaxID=2921639 RepID=UPI0030CC2073
MRNFSLYMMFIGILTTAISGNWIILNYENVIDYPKASYVVFGIGLAVVGGTFVMSRLFSYLQPEKVHLKDKRDALNEWLMTNLPFNKWVIGLVILPLVIAPFYSWLLLFTMLEWYLFSGLVVAGIIYMLKGERTEDDADWEYHGKTKVMLDLIDYRKHPFNISLILYILVIVSFVLSKGLDIPLYMETGGNPRYVTSLPSISFLMSSLMVVSTFIYIISHGDFFGFHKAELSDERVMLVHFAEIIVCGATLFILIFTLINALYAYF